MAAGVAVDACKSLVRVAAGEQKLADNRLTTPLFDICAFTRHIESAYAQMYERHLAGLPPEHIVVG